MRQFNTLQSITSRLKELGDQLSSSKLSQEELEELETLSRKLYEISVILNYKAKEEVFKTNSSKKKTTEKSQKEKKTKSKTDIENEPPSSEKREGSSIPGLVEFDFSGTPTSSRESSPAPEQKVDTEETHESQKKVEIEETPQNIEVPKQDVHSFYQHFTLLYKETLKDKISNSKVDSIKNAIGLNEKLQFIGDLFEGNSELYSQTIEELDQLEDNELAIKKLSQIATEKNWDKETELVDQFANIINRKYVK